MSIILRDPLIRQLLLDDCERARLVYPRSHYYRQPVRVHRLDWPTGPSTFDNALGELQSVLDNVNEAIGNYQGSLVKDLGSGGMKTTRTEDGNLQVAMDVSQFKPEEVSVKLCDDNLVVEAKTESSENDSYHKAEFKRWIKLPADVKHDAIKSTLTPDHKLLVEVPMNKPIENSRSRSIPIDIQKPSVVEDKKQQGDQQQQQQTQAKELAIGDNYIKLIT